MSWTVAKDEKTEAVAGAAFCEFLLQSYDDYLSMLYTEDGKDVQGLYEWLDEGNRLQVTYGIDGIHIVPIEHKEKGKDKCHTGSK